MFKRRFRLPSPALVISMVTLSLVLGGTAFAASTRETQGQEGGHEADQEARSVAQREACEDRGQRDERDERDQRDQRDECDQRDQRDQRDERHQRDERDQPRGTRGVVLRARGARGSPPDWSYRPACVPEQLVNFGGRVVGGRLLEGRLRGRAPARHASRRDRRHHGIQPAGRLPPGRKPARARRQRLTLRSTS